MHFGIGNAAAVKRVVVKWPSGIVQEISDAKPGRYNLVEEAAPAPAR